MNPLTDFNMLGEDTRHGEVLLGRTLDMVKFY